MTKDLRLYRGRDRTSTGARIRSRLKKSKTAADLNNMTMPG